MIKCVFKQIGSPGALQKAVKLSIMQPVTQTALIALEKYTSRVFNGDRHGTDMNLMNMLNSIINITMLSAAWIKWVTKSKVSRGD